MEADDKGRRPFRTISHDTARGAARRYRAHARSSLESTVRYTPRAHGMPKLIRYRFKGGRRGQQVERYYRYQATLTFA